MRREYTSIRKRLVIAGLGLGLSLGTIIAQETKYLMQDGDTLYSIARKYNVPVDAIMQLNGIPNPTKLRRGVSILIPDIYTVKKGDTLYGIAKQLDVSIDVITAANNIKSSAVLKPGAHLYIPRKEKSVPAKNETKEQTAKNEKQEKAVPVQVSVAKKEPEGKEFFWPHSGPKRSMDGKLEGISFDGNPGDPVLSIATGKVVWMGPYRGFGRVVFIQSEDGYIYVYAGNEDLFVSVGDAVKRGQKIGTLGVHPYEQRSSLYFIVYKDGKAIRPEDAPRI